MKVGSGLVIDCAVASANCIAQYLMPTWVMLTACPFTGLRLFVLVSRRGWTSDINDDASWS